MKMFVKFSFPIALTAMIIAGFGCSKSGGYGNNYTPPPTPPPPSKAVSLQSSATLGNYMVDKNGRTLYFFSLDADGKNHCTGDCEVLWPEFNVDNIDATNLGSGLNASDFGHITTASGKSQLTYKGWPLYNYAPVANGSNTPEQPGQTGGEGFAGLWFVGKPDYTIMIVDAQLVGQDGKDYKPDYTVGTGTDIYFSDGKGVSLYTFSKDSADHNRFTKADFSNDNVYPIYQTDQIVVPSTLNKSDFGSITVFGKKQLTYKHWPLYYFGQDAGARGSNKGVSFPAPGIWPVPVKDILAAPAP
jgi:predicted lipoprotein with Yx(FWY)xxD motif